MDDTEKPKNGLTAKREVPLALYAFIVRQGANNLITIPQDLSLITAYTTDEAMKALSDKYPQGAQITVDFKGAIPMEAVLKMFQENIDVDFLKKETALADKTKKDFYIEIVQGMQKSVSEFVDKPEDKPVLENALNKMLALVMPTGKGNSDVAIPKE